MRPLFCTIFSLFTHGANFKQNDSYAKCFNANFEQQQIVHAFLDKLNRNRHFEIIRPFLTFLPFRATGQWRTVFGTGFSFLTIRDSGARSFAQGLAF